MSTSSNSELAVLFINGLGDVSIDTKYKLVQQWWQRSGVRFHHTQVNWYDGKSFDERLAEMVTTTNELIAKFGRVAIIGSSAGGSLALNTFFKLRDKNICAINAHGRLRKGDYTNYNSLYHRAHLDTSKPSQSFYDSVIYAEHEVLPRLTKQEKRRILVLSQLTDLVVPLELMSIEGAREHKSFAFGHSGGFLAHLLADRDLIIEFADTELS